MLHLIPMADSQGISERSGLASIIGRDEIIRSIADKLLRRRLVTIVGLGGIGKTRIAQALVETLHDAFAEPARFIDLGPLRDDSLTAMAIASGLGLTIRSNDPLDDLVAYLKPRRMLIVLDCCEHLLDTLAPVVDRIVHEASDVFILATSREPLRVQAEYVNRVPPLAFPPPADGISAAEARRFPAVQLFAERAAARSPDFVLTDANAPLVADICRKLDGIALAIELAAASVPTHGVQGIDRLIEDRFRLLIQGRRTASPRHQTLRAALDWSYDLLSASEKTVFRRLAIFAGHWPLRAALEIVASDDLGEADVLAALGSLTAKSLISVDKHSSATRYHLLDTTRAYALERLQASGDEPELAHRHALFYADLFDELVGTASERDDQVRRITLEDAIGNVRPALRWCFSSPDRIDLGIALLIRAGPALLELSLLAECQNWAEAALARLRPEGRDRPGAMELLELFGLCLLFTGRHSQAIDDALGQAYAIAEAQGERARQMQLLGLLHHCHMRASDFRAAMEVARLSATVAHAMHDRGAAQLAHWLLGMAHFHGGNQQLALTHLSDQSGNNDMPVPIANRVEPGLLKLSRFGIDHRFRARSARARCLWVSGFPDQAIDAAKAVIGDATRHAHPITLSMSLVWTIPVFLLSGDSETAKAMIAKLSRLADDHALPYFFDMATGFEGEWLAQRGRHRQAEEKLRECLTSAGPGWYPLTASFFRFPHAEALLRVGRPAEALAAIEAAMAQSHKEADFVNLPEMLRIKARIFAVMGREAEAEQSYRASIALAQKQFAVAWELRAATALAELMADQGRNAEASALLSPLHDRIREGFATGDFVKVKALRERLAGL